MRTDQVFGIAPVLPKTLQEGLLLSKRAINPYSFTIKVSFFEPVYRKAACSTMVCRFTKVAFFGLPGMRHKRTAPRHSASQLQRGLDQASAAAGRIRRNPGRYD